jgi:hypothetical protein
MEQLSILTVNKHVSNPEEISEKDRGKFGNSGQQSDNDEVLYLTRTIVVRQQQLLSDITHCCLIKQPFVNEFLFQYGPLLSAQLSKT